MSALTSCDCFVPLQFTTQRSSRPDFGLREDVLLPWYHAFTEQYTRVAWGQWAGNASLLALYEDMAWEHGENRFGTWPETKQSEFDAVTGKRIRHAALP
ncbi:MAG: hypothetical protein P4L40_15435 [Terracidiphilus sp.]|nr:hypothetical protein [Terracidiphilus sp.]